MLKLFRVLAYLEGISFLVLLGIAMPLKYAYGMPEAVKWVGRIHGALFVGYAVGLAMVASEFSWSGKKTAQGFLAAILPFGPFYFDRKLIDR